MPLIEMDALTVFELFRLRTDIFIVEQRCIYAELDHHDRDPATLHLVGLATDEMGVGQGKEKGAALANQSDSLVACARLLFSKGCWRIGRVAVAENYRGRGVARDMVLKLRDHVLENFTNSVLELSAQSHLVGFYNSLGFEAIGGEYLEDGIPHVDMRYAG